jgi:hypothetical protein
MPYYEYEYIVQNLINILKEKQEAEEGQQSNMDTNETMKNARKMVPKDLNSAGFKMPSIPSFSGANFPSIPSSLKI